MPFPRASRALERFTVLDLTQVRSGPTCVRQLADWGANVIKIEPPPALDLRRAAGRPARGSRLPEPAPQQARHHAQPEGAGGARGVQADGEEGRRGGREFPARREEAARDRLQGSQARSTRSIILGSISGFGQDGPYAERPGFDQIAQGMGGLMSVTGLPGQGPVRVGIPVADLCAGLFCALGIMVALLEREKSKKGQHVATSLLQAQIFMLDFQAARWLVKGEVAGQAGNNHPTSMPTGVYKTADGHINIASTGQKIWERLCKALGATRHAGRSPTTRTRRRRSKHRDKLNEEIDQPHREAHQRRLDRAAQRGRRAQRPDLFDRPDVRRSAGRASRDGAAGEEARTAR